MIELIKRSNVDITLDSVILINQIINGEWNHLSVQEKKDIVKRNVDHLKIVKSGTYIDLSEFSSDQLNEVDSAIKVGESYHSSL